MKRRLLPILLLLACATTSYAWGHSHEPQNLTKSQKQALKTSKKYNKKQAKAQKKAIKQENKAAKKYNREHATHTTTTG